MHSRSSTVWALPTSRCLSSKDLSKTSQHSHTHHFMSLLQNTTAATFSSQLVVRLVSRLSFNIRFASPTSRRCRSDHHISRSSDTLGLTHLPFSLNSRCIDRSGHVPPSDERNREYVNSMHDISHSPGQALSVSCLRILILSSGELDPCCGETV